MSIGLQLERNHKYLRNNSLLNLIAGKYAIQQLVAKLPPAGSSVEHTRASEETIRAVLATLHEVFKDKDADSCEHARYGLLSSSLASQ